MILTNFLSFLVGICLINCAHLSTVNIAFPELVTSDWFALQDLYDSTRGTQWNWDPTKPTSTQWNFTGLHNPCEENWQALICVCGTITCSIQQIFMVNMNLEGTLPYGIGNFSQLVRLSIQNNINGLHGTLPESMGNLTTLQLMELGSNSLHGKVPETFSQLVNLAYFSVEINSFYSSVPEVLVNLPNLATLNLFQNFFTGTIPEKLFTSSKMVDLILAGNYLTGTLPAVGNESALTAINVDRNFLFGNLSTSVFTSKLLFLQVSNNYFSGTLPSNINNSVNLHELVINFNLFSGIIPAELGLLSQLQYIVLDHNEFSGTLPQYFVPRGNNYSDFSFYSDSNLDLCGTLPQSLCEIKMVDFNVGNNYFSGTVPPQLWHNCSTMLSANFDNNLFSGSLPVSLLSQCRAMTIFSVNNNYFTGTLTGFAEHMAKLKVLYIQYNEFTGPLHSLFSPINTEILYIYVSNNQLTGTIPSQLFENGTFNKLKSFSVSSNCISGSLPAAICNARELKFVDLYGINTATSCRKLILPRFLHIDSFYSSSVVTGGVPQCMFTLPALQSLHLAGNQLQYSFPDNLTLSSSLYDMSLAHNIVTGTIPSVVYTKAWRALDLSYNKLTGYLPQHLNKTYNTSLNLEVNRLSGYVPHSMEKMNNIDILNGNLFDCNFQRDNLPHHDPDYRTYQCGSNSFNQSIIIWFSLLGFFFGLLFILYLHHRHNARNSINNMSRYSNSINNSNNHSSINNGSSKYSVSKTMFFLYSLYKHWIIYFDSISKPPYNMHSLCAFNSLVRKIMLYLTLILVLAGSAVYILLSENDATVTYKYAWVVSSAYLSGQAPAIILMIAFMAWMLVLFVFWRRYLQHHYLNVPNNHTNSSTNNSTNSSANNSINISANQSSNNNKSISTESKHTTHYYRSFSFIAIALLNCVIMLAVNGTYVDIVLQYNTTAIFFAGLLIALFKLLWNDYAVRYMFEFCNKLLTRADEGRSDGSRDHTVNVMYNNSDTNNASSGMNHCNSNSNSNGSNNSSTTNNAQDHKPDRVVIEMPVMAFIVLFNTIIAPVLATAAVDPNCFMGVLSPPTPVVTKLSIGQCSEVGTTCYNEDFTSNFTPITYDAPFIYSYQCSGAILTNYASVYVYMCLIVTFAKPFWLLLMAQLYGRLSEKSKIRPVVSYFMYTIMKPLSELVKRPRILYREDRYVLRLISKIAIFLSFGVVFPPLAAIICVAVFTETILMQVMIGRFLHSVEDTVLKLKYVLQIQRESAHSLSLLVLPLMTLVLPFSAIFHSFFVFDTLGDQFGWKRAMWAAVLLAVFPGVIWVVYSIYGIVSKYVRSFGSSSSVKLNSGAAGPHVVEIELLETNRSAAHNSAEENESTHKPVYNAVHSGAVDNAHSEV